MQNSDRMDPCAVWLFDSECVLCNRGVQYTLKHEKAPSIRFVSIQSEAGRTLAKSHNLDPDDPATFLFVEKGRALDKSDALIALSRHLNGPARLTRAFAWVPKPLRDAAYGLVARNRYRMFGRVDRCIAPSADLRDRFVL